MKSVKGTPWGSTDFVMKVLAEKEETLHLSLALKQKGYALHDLEEKTAKLFSLTARNLPVKTREKRYVDARSVLCYFAVREYGISATDMARRLNMTQPAVSYAVKRGKILVGEGNYRL
jgi:putative transposase